MKKPLLALLFLRVLRVRQSWHRQKDDECEQGGFHFRCQIRPVSIRGASPLGLPYTRSRAPLRRRAPIAWLARTARSHLGVSVRFMGQLLVVQMTGRPMWVPTHDHLGS